MLLISPLEAATAIGAKCGGASPGTDDPQLLSILEFITARVEDALNVYSLTLDASTEVFALPRMPAIYKTAPLLRLRLTNGFLAHDSLVIKDAAGATVDAIHLDIDCEMGMVFISDWRKGSYSAQYQSGFEPEPEPATLAESYNSEHRLLLGTPAWLRALAVVMLTQWFRSVTLQPMISKSLVQGYDGLQQALSREIHTRIYSRYQRPRLNCIFAERRS